MDSKLDWTTLQLEGMSHNGRTTITDGSLVTFMFNNIRLPHSAADEAASNGYIIFKIKPLTNTIDLGDMVSATAAIYFDFNPPTITNTATTTYVNTLGNASVELPNLVIYPNPTQAQLQVMGVDSIVQLQVHTLLGTKVLKASGTSEINVTDLAAGVS